MSTEDRVIQLAKRRLEKGIRHEPRGYFDTIKLEYQTVDQTVTNLVTNGHRDVFRNNERYPVHITHAVLSNGFYNYTGNSTYDEDALIADPSEAQLIGVNLRFKDHNYMNPVYVPVPIWGNKPVFAHDIASRATSVWCFDEGRYVQELHGGCCVLSARDTLEVTMSLLSRVGVDSGQPASMGINFTGFGLISNRPYVFGSSTTLSHRGETVTLHLADFQNDGSEPILLTDMTVIDRTYWIIDEQSRDDHIEEPDIRRIGLNIRQIGNGTNQQWFQGPLDLPPLGQCPAVLCGITSGRAIVHEFPTPIIWEPGNGAEVSALGLTANAQDQYLHVGLFGYILIA